jgi:hypothetical protein
MLGFYVFDSADGVFANRATADPLKAADGEIADTSALWLAEHVQCAGASTAN